jgi:hypothetical protein
MDRRTVMQSAALALAGLSARSAVAHEVALPEGTASRGDFDYFIGSWRVEHRRLRKRLAGSNDWEEFAGRTRCQQMFGGLVNLNESVSYRGGRTSYGLGLRALDEPGGRWTDWYLSAGDLSKIDPPLYGRFAKGVGTFLSREMFEGRPILVRGQFASVSAGDARWEQAFSADDGTTWETNWVMRYLRMEDAK